MKLKKWTPRYLRKYLFAPNTIIWRWYYYKDDVNDNPEFEQFSNTYKSDQTIKSVPLYKYPYTLKEEKLRLERWMRDHKGHVIWTGSKKVKL